MSLDVRVRAPDPAPRNLDIEVEIAGADERETFDVIVEIDLPGGQIDKRQRTVSANPDGEVALLVLPVSSTRSGRASVAVTVRSMNRDRRPVTEKREFHIT